MTVLRAMESKMRIPAVLLEHPVEVLIAGALLLALIFGSSDRHAAEVAAPAAQAHMAAQMAAAGR
jgi:hypothetical protein